MTRIEPKTLLAGAAMKRGVAYDEPPSCLVCGARIGSGDPTIKVHGAKIHGALVHMRCAVRRRRVARR